MFKKWLAGILSMILFAGIGFAQAQEWTEAQKKALEQKKKQAEFQVEQAKKRAETQGTPSAKPFQYRSEQAKKQAELARERWKKWMEQRQCLAKAHGNPLDFFNCSRGE